MPSRLGRVAAHALGDQAQPRAASRPGRELQAPSGGETDGGRQLEHDDRHGAVAQCLFRHGQRVGLALRLRENQARGIEPDEPRGIELTRLPAFPRSLHLPAHPTHTRSFLSL